MSLLSASLALFGAYGLKHPAALNGPQFLKKSILTEPLSISGDVAEVPIGPGLGVEIEEAAMDEINRLNEADGLPKISTGIAVNTGDVIAGNIGSERRSKYGFVGHPMNVTSRIEDVTAGGEILIADSTLKSLQNPYRTGECRKLKVKGIDELLQVHQILEFEQ